MTYPGPLGTSANMLTTTPSSAYNSFFLPVRRYASAGNSDRNVSVCLSVLTQYRLETDKAR